MLFRSCYALIGLATLVACSPSYLPSPPKASPDAFYGNLVLQEDRGVRYSLTPPRCTPAEEVMADADTASSQSVASDTTNSKSPRKPYWDEPAMFDGVETRRGVFDPASEDVNQEKRPGGGWVCAQEYSDTVRSSVSWSRLSAAVEDGMSIHIRSYIWPSSALVARKTEDSFVLEGTWVPLTSIAPSELRCERTERRAQLRPVAVLQGGYKNGGTIIHSSYEFEGAEGCVLAYAARNRLAGFSMDASLSLYRLLSQGLKVKL